MITRSKLRNTLGLSLFSIAFLMPGIADAQVSGTVRVTARDQQNLALPGVDVTIKAKTSTLSQAATTGPDGEAVFPVVPAGEYVVSAHLEGFATVEREVTVLSNIVTPVQLQLGLAGLTQAVEVTAVTVNPESTRTANTVQRDDILRQPDVDRSGSLAMITNNTPGAYMMHDLLHVRGGHAVSWEIDGVPVPSSALAAVGSQFDPKDISSLEINRGGLPTNLGDRPYSVFNVVPRSGFEGERFAELTGSYGSYQLFNSHFAFGDHSDNQKFAYFGSVSANRTDFGLERVDPTVLHDTADNFSGFTSIIYNKSTNDQFRFVSAVRTDRYQVPNTPEQEAIGIDDREIGSDSFANFTWLHTSTSGDVLTVSPYFHYNRQQYIGGPNDPLVTTDDVQSQYVGAYASWLSAVGKHTLRFGTDSFAEHDDSLFGLKQTTGDLLSATQTQVLWSNVVALFAEDSFRATPWLTLNGGLRFEHFAGNLSEHALTPRLGAAVSLPRGMVLRGSYSRYYQHPSSSTISGPILDFALQEGFGYLPLHGERDEVWEVGLGIPIHGWTLDFDAYRNMVDNLADHDVLGNSNLVFPLSIEHGRIRAFESTLKSPTLFKRLQIYYAFAYQIAEGQGAVTGGLTDFEPPSEGYFYLDHDQRVTFNSGFSLDLPTGFWASGTFLIGSGFLLGDGPDHLPAYGTVDLAVGKRISDKLALKVSATNLADKLYLTGFQNSFAGTHYGSPRQVSVQAQYKFHY